MVERTTCCVLRRLPGGRDAYLAGQAIITRPAGLARTITWD